MLDQRVRKINEAKDKQDDRVEKTLKLHIPTPRGADLIPRR
jgi:hypothetical protein